MTPGPSAVTGPAVTGPAVTGPAAATGSGAPTAGPGAAPGRAGRSRALSPSRAGDFVQCPLLYRFRVVDRLPEVPTAAAARGTVVHAVLDALFDLPPGARTVQAAQGLVAGQWDRLRAEDPELAAAFAGEREGQAGMLTEAHDLLARWFALEDPTRLDPAERELYVETILDEGTEGALTLRGYVDRLDVATDGRMRVVDYKTGRAPREAFEAKALFQMKFYALVLWRLHGRVPALLQLVYLGSGEVLRHHPDEGALRATERKIRALWTAIERAVLTGDWRASPGRLCDWCPHRRLCPAFGGTPPPVPAGAADLVTAPSAAAPRTPGLDEE